MLKNMPLPTSSRRAPCGFTLIELLTVIAIIGVLAAIIIPTVGKVRQTARETQGMSNLRQIALSSQLFAAENKGQFPSDYLGEKLYPTATERKWTTCLRPYLPGTDARRNELIVDPSSGIVPANPDVQFGLNALLAPNTNLRNNRDYKNYTTNNIKAPAMVILAFDAILDPTSGYTWTFMNNMGGGWWMAPHGLYSTNSASNADRPIPTKDIVVKASGDGDIAYRARGNTAAKVAFVDGHTAVMKRGEILARHINPHFTN
jgi:prepilin-type N-terminal cleavage/methylation domain-containing protein